MIINNRLTLLQNYLLQNYSLTSQPSNIITKLSHLNINLLLFKNRNKKNTRKIKTKMFLKLLIIFKLCFNNLGIVLKKKKHQLMGMCIQFNSKISSSAVSLIFECLLPTLYKLRLKFNVKQTSCVYINIFLSSVIFKLGFLQKRFKYFYINGFFCKIFIGIANSSKSIFNLLILNYLRY